MQSKIETLVIRYARGTRAYKWSSISLPADIYDCVTRRSIAADILHFSREALFFFLLLS